MNYQKLVIANNHLSGEEQIFYFKSGLRCKFSHLYINHDTQEPIEGAFHPDVRLIVTLQGKSEIQFSQTQFQQNAHQHPQITLLPIIQTALGKKIYQGKQHQIEFVIFIPLHWLQERGFADITQYHLKTQKLVFTHKMNRLLNRFKQTVQGYHAIEWLEKETDLTTLITESLKQYYEKPLQKNKSDLIMDLCQKLESGEFDHYTLSDIAKYCHTNITSLQQQFHQTTQLSIGAYLRRCKLERAYRALLQNATVIQAAEIAKYTNPDNFSTAFKKQFGISPREVKKQILF
ncbi:helix-turn-helix transcriptional regulator [Pelistega ratti]|uniref:helix-turn-helix transcriptional regulator n=1 Tax=Pelistega ratti TaxID=2652177 RepID=UPI00135CEEE1|nr:AraC family transcriptional regulator [Pelistega ratti]